MIAQNIKRPIDDLKEKKFQIALDFLKRDDLGRLTEGWIELEEGVRASIQRYTSFFFDENRFETHEKYYDVQFVIEGQETCCVCSRSQLGDVAIPYDDKNDVEFYDNPIGHSEIVLNAGDYIVLGPDDAHKPRCVYKKQMPIKKVVVKVPV